MTPNKKPHKNLYQDLRKMALNVTADKLGLPAVADHDIVVYGVVTDIDMKGGIATLVTYATGDVSLYLSTGGGFMGVGQHEAANNAAKNYVRQAQGYLEQARRTELTPSPEQGYVCFYLLTNNGKYLATDKISNIESGNSALKNLFYGANAVLTQVRATAEKN